MKSVKLSISSRSEILRSIMEGFKENYFKGKPYDNEQSLRDAASGERIEVMTGLWERTYRGVCLAGVPEWMLKTESFSIKIEGSNRVELAWLPRMPGKCSAIDVILDAKEECLFAEYDRLVAELNDYQKSCQEFEREVCQILNSVNTTKQLVELWPTAEQYLPAHIADPELGVKLPALTVSRLDERLKGGV